MVEKALTVLALAALCAPALAAERAADLLLLGGKVHVGPDRHAQAVAVAGNRVLFVGNDADALRFQSAQTRVIELKGRTVTPGFHDAHAHFLKGGLSLTQADLHGVATVAEVVTRLRAYAQANPAQEWIIGRGWDQAALPDQRLPTRRDLDEALPGKPIALTDAHGRKLWLNSEALQRAGIGPRTPKPPKGEIVRGAKDEPTGILIEQAMQLALRALPRPDRAAKLEALRLAMAQARRSGVTTVHWLPDLVDIPPEETLALWKHLQQNGEVTLRFVLFGRLEDPKGFIKLRRQTLEFPRTRLVMMGLKGFVDGDLGTRSAALLKPYFDAPQTRGDLLISARALRSAVAAAHAAGLQVALHASGDRAVRLALDACAASQDAARETGHVLPAVPCRLEHIETIDPADLPRLGELGAAASLQPARMLRADEIQNHLPNRLGERAQRSYALRALEDEGATVLLGSDWPASPLAPGMALYAALTRRHLNGKPDGGWMPSQKISMDAALRHYTADPARAAGWTEEVGELRIGRLADLVVWDRDLFAPDAQDLRALAADYTIFDGKIVFARDDKK